ncbi:MAG: hypothetical protein II748_08040, partial [Clostridia bacterium]|nr:hypothetical protein [Clostridia bacterium]
MKATLRKLLPILITVCVIASVAVIGAVTAGATTYTVPDNAVKIGNKNAEFNTENGVYYIDGWSASGSDKTLTFAADSELYLNGAEDGLSHGFLIVVDEGVTLKIHLIGDNEMIASRLTVNGTVKVDGDGTLDIDNIWGREGVVGNGEFVLNEGTVSVNNNGNAAEISVD